MVAPPRFPLCQLPTPLHRLDRMSEKLGLDLWIKRDDLTGFALGGNKGRKLEYLVADALAANAETVVTCGAAQSNFVRQLGAACAVAGLRCVAAVMDLPYEVSPLSSGGEGLGVRGLNRSIGNPQLNALFGVETHPFPDGPWEVLYAHAEALASERERKGERVYRIPIGGSSPLGAYAFYQAAKELPESFDLIVTSSSSGSTQTGLAYAFHDTKTGVLGVCADPEPEIAEDFARLGYGLANLLDLPYRLPSRAYRLSFDFVGKGYGVPSEAGDAAVETLARAEGILLDPIYSGKAFAALIALAEKGEIAGRVLFWHTGGLPTLFAR